VLWAFARGPTVARVAMTMLERYIFCKDGRGLFRNFQSREESYSTVQKLKSE
jgi:hypothetical protein